MATIVQTGLTNVTGTVESIPQKRTVSIVAGQQISAGTATIFTVGASKVRRILSIVATMSSAASAGGLATTTDRGRVLLNGVEALGLSGYTITGEGGRLANSVMWSYESCPVLTAGQTAQVTSNNNMMISCSISYIEEDA